MQKSTRHQKPLECGSLQTEEDSTGMVCLSEKYLSLICVQFEATAILTKDAHKWQYLSYMSCCCAFLFILSSASRPYCAALQHAHHSKALGGQMLLNGELKQIASPSSL